MEDKMKKTLLPLATRPCLNQVFFPLLAGRNPLVSDEEVSGRPEPTPPPLASPAVQ